LLEDRGVPYRYREYTDDPLSAKEIEAIVERLDVPVKQLLRKNDRAYKELGLTGDEDEIALIGHMANHPTLLQRPIAVLRGRAVVGRPVERLLELLSGL
jgi:arsenate reductase